MKRMIFLLAIVALTLTACGGSNAAPTLVPTSVPMPVITMDVEHMVNPMLAYEIPAGEGFTLDATSYSFGPTGGPSMIQVVMDGREFTGTWTPGGSVQTVRAASLLPPAGFNPLTGFPAGKQLIIAVGQMSDKGRFEPLWVAVVNVI